MGGLPATRADRAQCCSSAPRWFPAGNRRDAIPVRTCRRQCGDCGTAGQSRARSATSGFRPWGVRRVPVGSVAENGSGKGPNQTCQTGTVGRSPNDGHTPPAFQLPTRASPSYSSDCLQLPAQLSPIWSYYCLTVLRRRTFDSNSSPKSRADVFIIVVRSTSNPSTPTPHLSLLVFF